MTLANVVNAIGTLIGSPASGSDPATGMIGWIGSYVGTITSNPLLLAFVLTPAIFWALGAIRRIMRSV